MRVFNPSKLRYARILDFLARFIFRIGRDEKNVLHQPLHDLSPKKILFIESHLIGDVVMAIPALQALRARADPSHITLVAGPWAKDLLGNQDLVDEFVETRFPWSAYDYSILNIKSLLTVLRKLRRTHWDVGIDCRGDIRNIFFLYFTGAKRRVSYNFTGGEYLLTDVIRDVPHLEHIIDHNLNVATQLGCTNMSNEPTLFISKAQSVYIYFII